MFNNVRYTNVIYNGKDTCEILTPYTHYNELNDVSAMNLEHMVRSLRYSSGTLFQPDLPIKFFHILYIDPVR